MIDVMYTLRCHFFFFNVFMLDICSRVIDMWRLLLFALRLTFECWVIDMSLSGISLRTLNNNFNIFNI